MRIAKLCYLCAKILCTVAKNILTVILLVLASLIIVGSCVERKTRVEAPAPDPQLSARVHNSIRQAIHNLDLGRQNEAFIRLKEAEADIDTIPPRLWP